MQRCLALPRGLLLICPTGAKKVSLQIKLNFMCHEQIYKPASEKPKTEARLIY